MSKQSTADYVRLLAKQYGISPERMMLEAWVLSASAGTSDLDNTQLLLLALARRRLISNAELDRLNGLHLAEKQDCTG